MASAENTSHQTNQSTSSSAPPSAPLNKMTNASNEPMAQHHQQELIRLLAQHFNNQLAGRAAYDQQLALPVPLTSIGCGALNSFQSALVHYQQQEQQQLRLNQGAINFCTQQSRAANFEPPTSQTFLNNHHSARAPPPPTSATMNPFSMTNPMLATSSHSGGLPSGAHPAATCNPLANDMNLFNALNCFGLPNEQLVLSLQQHYLFQAANAARQIESRFAGRAHSNNDDLTLNTGRQSSSFDSGARQNFRHHLTTKSAHNGNLPELGNGMSINEHGGRDLLKFSINTILGNGAPLSAVSDHQRSRSGASPIDRFFGAGNASQLLPGTNKVADENRDSQRATGGPISPECDPDIMTDIDSEPSLSPISNVHSEPQGMATNLSRLSGDVEHPNINHHHNHHHQSASSSASPKKSLATSSLTSNDASHHQQSISFLAGSTAFPWTVASRGKPRRGMMRRAVFSDSQRVGLEKRFQLQKYISKPDRKKLAEKLGLRDSQVKIWFQNRRMKWRNSKERELLSAGGSREQTLPTRNNPNPDLSDVGETIKRLVASNNTNTGSNIGTV